MEHYTLSEQHEPYSLWLWCFALPLMLSILFSSITSICCFSFWDQDAYLVELHAWFPNVLTRLTDFNDCIWNSGKLQLPRFTWLPAQWVWVVSQNTIFLLSPTATPQKHFIIVARAFMTASQWGLCELTLWDAFKGFMIFVSERLLP